MLSPFARKIVAYLSIFVAVAAAGLSIWALLDEAVGGRAILYIAVALLFLFVTQYAQTNLLRNMGYVATFLGLIFWMDLGFLTERAWLEGTLAWGPIVLIPLGLLMISLSVSPDEGHSRWWVLLPFGMAIVGIFGLVVDLYGVLFEVEETFVAAASLLQWTLSAGLLLSAIGLVVDTTAPAKQMRLAGSVR